MPAWLKRSWAYREGTWWPSAAVAQPPVLLLCHSLLRLPRRPVTCCSQQQRLQATGGSSLQARTALLCLPSVQATLVEMLQGSRGCTCAGPGNLAPSGPACAFRVSRVTAGKGSPCLQDALGGEVEGGRHAAGRVAPVHDALPVRVLFRQHHKTTNGCALRPARLCTWRSYDRGTCLPRACPGVLGFPMLSLHRACISACSLPQL